MSSIVTSQGIVHYEAYGRGKPVILLHGWINSWGVWQDVMIDLAENGRLKVYALDFWGFGDSGKQNTPPFKVESYVQMVDQFMEILGIERAPILGHSMGGTVALAFALNYPQRATKVGAVGSPIEGKSLNVFLRLAGLNWVQLAQSLPALTRVIVLTLIRMNTARDSARVRKMLLHDVDKTSLESFFRSIGDLRRTDLSPRLVELTNIPVLGIYGKHDNIVNPKQVHVLQTCLPNANTVVLNNSRHFPMLDEPAEFHTAVREFLSSLPGTSSS